MKSKGRPLRAALFIVSVPCYQGSFGRLPDQRSERLGKVLTIVAEEHPARASLHQKGDQWGIRLGRVAVSAGENQVVRPVVCGLTPARAHVVECDRFVTGLGAAIRADRAVLSE
jgi:hypothetical protein